MRLDATRGAGEDDPTQQDHCVRESQGNSRVKDHAENSCKPRYAKHETDVEQHSGLMIVKLVALLRQGKAISSRLATP